MRRGILLLLVLWPLMGMGATNTARIRWFGFSVKVEPGTAQLAGLEYKLTFSSADFSPPNDEMFPVFEDDVTHATLFQLEGPEYPEPLPGELILSVPDQLDANTNGIPDFYEVAAAIPATVTNGFWGSPAAEGEAKVTWAREAGQASGTCRIQLTSREFGDLPEFTHAFHIYEYDGTLTYEPGTDPIRGSIQMNRVGVEGARLSGPVVLTRMPTNRLHQVTFGESNLTNELGQVVPISLGDIEQDPDYSMDYFGALALSNGDPATPEIDYELFYVGIDDPNDADQDGIPDLTDDSRPPPTPPTLAVARKGDQLELTLAGETGWSYALERSSSMDPDSWIVEQTVQLTESPLRLTVTPAPVEARFYRLRWP